MKCAVIGLVKGYNKLNKYYELIERNNKLYENFIKYYPYDVIIVHEGNIIKKHQEYLQNNSQINLIFLDISDYWNNIEGSGYNKMCRFWINQVYKYIQDYDYILRLDDDGLLVDKVPYDIFQHMKDNDYEYGYIRRKIDKKKKLGKVPAKYQNSPHKDVTIESFCFNYFNQDLKPRYNFYNNFFTIKVSVWNKPELQKFINSVENRNNNFYREGKLGFWGDSNVQAVCVKKWISKEKIVCFTGIKYKHGSHGYTNYPDVKHEW